MLAFSVAQKSGKAKCASTSGVAVDGTRVELELVQVRADDEHDAPGLILLAPGGGAPSR